MKKNRKNFTVALLCGGPSLERGISLNSARSVLDHLNGDGIEVLPIYFDIQKRPYKISQGQLYSNTPSDFDFKLQKTATALTEKSLIRFLRSVDIAFPVMHGAFGEDGGIQNFLEKNKIPFVGSSGVVCKKVFDKYIANEHIRINGFFALPSIVLKIFHRDHRLVIEKFFKDYGITRAVVKPATGGSSIGVFSVSTPAEALEKAALIFSKRMDTRVVVEPFATGTEFTLIILQNRFGLPVAIIPTEIETDYTEHQIFDFRKKYLPTRRVMYHCPPRFDQETIEKIQVQGEQLFSLFGMRDFARFDGWVLPSGQIWFSDFNPVSGMEQNSFLFQQASRIGFSHRDILRYLLRQACRRYGLNLPSVTNENQHNKKPVAVLFGGRTSERQVSLMSGTNVWLKLRCSDRYRPEPFLLDTDHHVWRLPYTLTLNHTVEEIIHTCNNIKADRERLIELERRIQNRLALESGEATEQFFEPTKQPLTEFLKETKFLFNALHGGFGEDGRLQSLCQKSRILFNGCGEFVSRQCLDKWQTNRRIEKLGIEGVQVAPAKLVTVREIALLTGVAVVQLWKNICQELGAKTLIVKPRADGCSSGIVHLYSSDDLHRYLDLVTICAPFIPKKTFTNQHDIVEMPLDPIEDLLFEKFIETDIICVRGSDLSYSKKTGWLEVTVGVLEQGGKITVFNPSITVAEGEVLTVEEKFQGGTGINITPPPVSLVKPKALARAKMLVGAVAKKIGIEGYARIDAFLNIKTGKLIIIEINTLPGLTPSTVLYHQALAENPAIFPKEFLEKLILNKGY